jgi:hypothetical protein
VRPLTDAERETLEANLRSPDAFVLRRAQIVLASAGGFAGRDHGHLGHREHAVGQHEEQNDEQVH